MGARALGVFARVIFPSTSITTHATPLLKEQTCGRRVLGRHGRGGQRDLLWRIFGGGPLGSVPQRMCRSDGRTKWPLP